MATIQENLTTLSNIKTDIKNAIIGKGVDAGDDITEYGDKIREISGGEIDYSKEPLTFEAIEDSAVSLSNFGSNAPNIEYSFDKSTWTTWDYSNIDIATGSKLYMRGNNANGVCQDDTNNSKFVMTGKIAAKGNLYSLLSKTSFADILDLTPYGSFVFYRLFQGCTPLIYAPMLPATILSERCYHGLFGMTGLLKTPALPATTLAIRCYAYMFDTCENLTEIPTILPATTLKDFCYAGLFCRCYNIKQSPYLAAKTLVSHCYDDLFYNCNNLQYINAAFTTTPTNTLCAGWVTGVASTGVFVKADDATWDVTGTYGVPSGWSVMRASQVPVIEENDYLCFEAIEDSAVSLSNFGSNAPNIEYSFNKSTWTTWDYSNIDIEAGSKLYMRGDNPTGLSFSNTKYSIFSITGTTNVSGNIMYLINKNEQLLTIPNQWCFFCLFRDTPIYTAPDLPAVVLKASCYRGLFQHCINLQSCPELPAITLYDYCYRSMFYDCYSIKNAPYLPATTLVTGCYSYMFVACSSLQYIKAEYLTTPSNTYNENMFSSNAGVSLPSTGCFIKGKNATWTTIGVYACPSGWTLITSVS